MLKFKRKTILMLLLSIGLILALAACGGDSEEPASSGGNDDQGNNGEVSAGDPAKGADLFASSCASCHGPEGLGIEGLGKDMTTSDFISGLSDAEMLEFIKTGRPVGDPLNTTNVDMPPKGGNPALSDEQIMDIIAHIRTLQK